MYDAIESLAKYFNSRANSPKNSFYINGYSSKDEASDFYNDVVDELYQLIDLNETTHLLEIGCGTGEIIKRLDQRGIKTTGIDISIEMVRLAREQKLDAIHYDGKRLPFSDASFTNIIIYQVLTNFPSQQLAKKLIAEAARLLKPHGQLLIGALPDPHESSFPTHNFFNLKSLYSRLRSYAGHRHLIGYFSYEKSFFIKLYENLQFSSINFVRCGLKRSAWQTKYHVVIKK